MELIELYKNRNLPNEVDLHDRPKGKTHREDNFIREVVKNYKVKHLKRNSHSRKRVKRKIKTPFLERWSFPIRYSIDTVFSDEEKTKIREGLQTWEDATCASFKESNDTTIPALFFISESGCFSYIGPIGIYERINLISLAKRGCVQKAIIEHEIGHALGLIHEQTRPDRDSYISVNWANIKHDSRRQYDIVSLQDHRTYNIEYDYGSVMQYGKEYFRIGKLVDTMNAKHEMYDNVMGQRVGLSFSDIKIFNREYCSGACNGYRNLEWPDCQHGGYRDPNNCDVCKCPDGWTGSICNMITPQAPADVVCGGELNVTTLQEELMTPSYALGYNNATSCTWLLTADKGSHVIASFVGNFGTYCIYDYCITDWVEVRYNDLHHTGPRFCCGTKPNELFVSRGNQMMILFRSNIRWLDPGSTHNPNDGFKLQFSSTPRVGRRPCGTLKLSGLSQSRKQQWRTGMFKLQSMPWNSRPVYKHLVEPVFMFHDSGYWLIGSTIGETQSGMRVFSSALQPQDVTEVWQSFNGTTWVAESSLVTSCSSLCDTIWLSGVSRRGPHSYILGAYTFVANDQNGAPIYKKVTKHLEVTISMSGGNKWSIVSEFETITTSFTTKITNPVEISNTWTVASGSIVFECYFGPGDTCRDVRLTGGIDQKTRQGIYSLYGPLYNGRPVYIHESGIGYLFHVVIDQATRLWYNADTIGVIESGFLENGRLRVQDTAMTADGITGEWEAYSYSVLDWTIQPYMTTTCVMSSCNEYIKLVWTECQHGGYRDPSNCDVCKCPDGWTGATCNIISSPADGVCGGELNVTTQIETLMTPSYNLGYTNATSCTWLLTANKGSQITASFIGDFSINCISNETENLDCASDWVEVRYYDLQHTGPRFCCGVTPNETFVSQGNQMMILLRSNKRLNVSGSSYNRFKLQYFSKKRADSLPCESLKISGLIFSINQRWRTGIFKLQSMPWNSRPVYKHLLEPVFMFYDSGYWLTGSSIGDTTQPGIRVLSSALEPMNVTEVWESFNGKIWITEPDLVSSCSAICDTIWLSGFLHNGPRGYLLGTYSFVNNDSNGAAIYKKVTTHGEVTISMIDGNKWSIVSENETITTPFTTIITNPVELSKTWTVESGKAIVLECYFGSEETCSNVTLMGGTAP
ncbi:unnamed protein product, partial [Owenia fusiformis]